MPIGTQADSKVGESAFLDCFSVDNVLAVALCDSLNGAVVDTSAAADASISNNVSHDFPSIYVLFVLRTAINALLF